MIHDAVSGIILDICMCHCILIMATVAWKLQRTFKGDNLISSLNLLSSFPLLARKYFASELQSKGPSLTPERRGFRIIKRRNRKWQMKSSQPKRGNKAQIWNTAEGDKPRENLFFFLSLYFTYKMQMELSCKVTMETVVEEIDFSPLWVITATIISLIKND